MAPRPAQREYASVIADSPIRHAIFNKPFSSLRRKTENLLDTITGGTLPSEVEEEMRKDTERKRELTCRFCKLLFADQRGLSKHYELFPAHLRDERKKPERKIVQTTDAHIPHPTLPRHDTIPRMSTSNSMSTSTINETFVSGPINRQASLQRSKARSQPDMHTEFIPSSRPSPSRSPISNDVTQSPSYLSPSSPLTAQTTSHLASDFYASSQNINSPLYNLGFHTGSPYSMPIAKAAPAPIPNQAVYRAPQAAAMLPAFDFEEKFTRIPREGIPEPSKAKQVHRPDPSELNFIAEKNREAGARSAARSNARYQNAVNSHSHYSPHRGASQSEALSINTEMARQGPSAFPNSFNGLVRAIAATGATDGSPAIFPTQQMSTYDHKRSNTWAPLADEEEEKAVPTTRTRSRTASTNGRQWGALMEALPGSPAKEKKAESPFKELQPVKTGLTSFSLPQPEEPASSGNTSSVTTRSRRNTNPFLNREFMKSIPNALKTPPLSPSSPWGNGSASPGNPFKQLTDEDDDDDRMDFFDAPDGPKTPADEISKGRMTSNKGSGVMGAPFGEATSTVPGAF